MSSSLLNQSQRRHDARSFDGFLREADDRGVAEAEKKLHIKNFGDVLLEFQKADDLASERVHTPDAASALRELLNDGDPSKRF